MNKYIFIVSGIAVGTAGSIYLSKIIYKKGKEAIKQAKERELARQAEREELRKKFDKLKSNFKKIFTDEKIAAATLSNEKLKNKEDKSYIYDILSRKRFNILNCTFTSYLEGYYDEEATSFADLYTAFTRLDADALEAKILSLRTADDKKAKLHEEYEKKRAEQEAHKRELEVMEQKRKAECDVYKAKLDVEKAKLETICKAMTQGTKNISNSLNIKTHIGDD